jgi:hypothetical protein
MWPPYNQANTNQKTHSANIIAGPYVYEAQEKKKGQKIIEMDCRGLEFTEFKPDVSTALCKFVHPSHAFSRVIGRSRVLRPTPPSRLLTSLMESGMTMMRSPARRLASRRLPGLWAGREASFA